MDPVGIESPLGDLLWESSLDHLHCARDRARRFAYCGQADTAVRGSFLFTLFRVRFERLVSCTLTWERVLGGQQ